jgi:DNA adenine methylase
MRWHGNKSKYLKQITSFFPSTISGAYIEPFIGSGAVFLHLKPNVWIINDINKDVINIWESVRTHLHEIEKYFKIFKEEFPKSNLLRLQYARDLLAKMLKINYTPQRAAYYILAKFCAYMGIINKNDEWTITSLDTNIYRDDKLSFLSDSYWQNIYKVSNYLKQSTGIIEHKDYKKVLLLAKRNDFVFLDPPYVESHDYCFKYNHDEDVSFDFMKELHIELRKLDKKGVKWLMTQADTELVRRVFCNYDIKTFRVYRAPSKSYKNELIIINYSNI